MNKRFVITTAVGLVFSTAAVAQSPSGSSSSPSQQRPATTTQSTTQSAPPAANTTTTQGQAPATSGTAQTQPTQPANPSAAQSAPSAQQPATNQAQTPAQSRQPATNSAQSPAQTGQPATNNAQAQSNTNVSTSVNVDAQQQTRISQSISRLNVRPMTNVNFSVTVGTVIPRNVHLQALPPDIAQIVPQYRGYGFVVVRDEIVITEPSTYRIVSVLPRSGNRAAAAPARTQAKMKFSDKQRTAIRQHTRAGRETTTTGSSARAQMRVGDRVPDTVEIREFPETIYREVPTVRQYRYLEMDDRSYLVEPRRRIIVEEID